MASCCCSRARCTVSGAVGPSGRPVSVGGISSTPGFIALSSSTLTSPWLATVQRPYAPRCGHALHRPRKTLGRWSACVPPRKPVLLTHGAFQARPSTWSESQQPLPQLQQQLSQQPRLPVGERRRQETARGALECARRGWLAAEGPVPLSSSVMCTAIATSGATVSASATRRTCAVGSSGTSSSSGSSSSGCGCRGKAGVVCRSSGESDVAVVEAEEAEGQEADRPAFDLNVAVLLAGFAFESYNDPEVTETTLTEVDANSCKTVYTSSKYACEEYTGQLVVKVLRARDCPPMDLWGTSDPFAVVHVGEATAKTQTCWATNEPEWREELRLLVRGLEAAAQEEEQKEQQTKYLRVSLWDAGILLAPRRMGSAVVPLDTVCDGELHTLTLPLEGPGGGGQIEVEVEYKSFAELAEEEKKRWRMPSLSDFLPAEMLSAVAPQQLLASITGAAAATEPAISSSEFVRSALKAFDTHTPLPPAYSASSLSGEAQEGAPAAAPGDTDEPVDPAAAAAAAGGAVEGTKKLDVASAASFARTVLEESGWLSPQQLLSRPMSSMGEEVGSFLGAELGKRFIIGEGLGSTIGGKLGSVLLPVPVPQGVISSLLQRREEMQKILVDSGMALPGAQGVAEAEGQKGGVAGGDAEPAAPEASEGDKGWGGVVPTSITELRKAVFGQTEGLLGSLAILGASRAAEEAKQEQEARAAAAAAAAAASTAEDAESAAEGEGELEMTEEQRAAMKEVFGRAETAVEAWAMLASSLGQRTFVKSEFEKMCFLDNTESDTQVALWRDSRRRRIVVAFRGTEQTKLKDLLTDISLAPSGLNPERAGGGDNFSDEPMVHSGFLTAYDSVRMRVISVLRAVTDPNRVPACSPLVEEAESDNGSGDKDAAAWHVYVTGHSLGGALATLLTHELARSRFVRERGIRLSMYNYGSPRVGNAAFANSYNEVVRDSWRIVNARDIIPTVPKLMGYRHVCCPVYLSGGGDLTFGAGTPASAMQGLLPNDEDGYLGSDTVGETTTSELLSKFMQGEQQVLDRLIAAEVAMFSALRDGTAIMMHMEDFYYIALLKKVQAGLGVRLGAVDVAEASP